MMKNYFPIVIIALVASGGVSQSYAAQEFQIQNVTVSVDEPFQAVEKVREVIKSLPTIDQFSTAADRLRYIKLVSDLPLQRLVFKAPFCSRSYNADTQSFRISLIPTIGESKSGLWHLDLARESKTTGKYAGQTAFGASAQVEKVLRQEVSIRWQFDSKPASVSRQEYLGFLYYQYVVEVAVPSEQARAETENIACLIVFRPTLLYSTKDQGKSAWLPFLLDEEEHTAPTFRAPYDTTTKRTVLIGQFDELWVVNERTGKVYARFN